jgi:hypothetical protein
VAKRKEPVLTIPPALMLLLSSDGRVAVECSHHCPFLNTAAGHRCCLGWQDRDRMKPGRKCVPGEYRLVKA